LPYWPDTRDGVVTGGRLYVPARRVARTLIPAQLTGPKPIEEALQTSPDLGPFTFIALYPFEQLAIGPLHLLEPCAKGLADGLGRYGQ
jgi:hypothetical protein